MKKDKLKRRPLVPRGPMWIEHDEGMEVLVEIDVNPATGGDLPLTDFKEEDFRPLWKAKGKAKLEPLSPEVMKTFIDLTTDYMIERDYDEGAAYPGRVNDYLSKVETAVTALLPLLDPKDPRDRTVLNRITGSAFILHALPRSAVAALVALRRNAIALRGEMANPRQGEDGKKKKHDRQVRFAGKFLELFKENNWPKTRNDDSLMSNVLGFCLEAAGDTHAKPYDLLSVAAKRAREKVAD